MNVLDSWSHSSDGGYKKTYCPVWQGKYMGHIRAYKGNIYAGHKYKIGEGSVIRINPGSPDEFVDRTMKFFADVELSFAMLIMVVVGMSVMGYI